MLILVGVFFYSQTHPYAQTADAPENPKTGMALPGEECRVKPLDEWSDIEKWVWIEICEGYDANLDKRSGNTKFNPKNPNHSDELLAKRELSPRFLKTILLSEPFRSAIPHRGVRISGAYFINGINLRDASIERPLMLLYSLFKSWVLMNRLTTPSYISFYRSRFNNRIDMRSALISGDMLMRRAEFDDVHLRAAKIGGNLNTSNSKFHGWLDMNTVEIGKDIVMRNAEFRDVVLREANVGGHIDMNGSVIEGRFSMASASVGRDLLMRNARFSDIVVLKEAQLGGALLMSGSTFEKEIDMVSALVERELLMRNARFDELVNLSSLTVGSNLIIQGAALSVLDLTDATINGDLWIGLLVNKRIEWKGPVPKIILRDASVGALKDTKDNWPDNLELDGFTYKRFENSEPETLAERGSEWFIKWLAKDETYSPQPYRQLAGVFRGAGLDGISDEVLFANRERERRESNPFEFKWWLLSFLRFVYGYGYGQHSFWAMFRVAVAFIALGIFVLRFTRERNNILSGFLNKACYSLDMLLPVVRLNERHYEVELETKVARYYFYAHKITGYLLIFFVVAWLTNLTK